MENFQLANTLLSSVNASFTSQAVAVGINNLDIWKLINWLIVSFYWTVLADVGQINPTTYAPNSNLVSDLSVNLTAATLQPFSNNIFINNTLFQIYSEYLINTVLPLVRLPIPPTSTFILNDPNRQQGWEMTIFQSYSCMVRELKSPLAFIVSVGAADYAFIKAAYSIFMLVAAWLQKRKYRKGINSLELYDLERIGTAQSLHEDGVLVCCDDCLKMSRTTKD